MRLTLFDNNYLDEIDRAFERSFSSYGISASITQENDNEILRIPMAGYKQSDLEVSFENGLLKVKADNKKVGKFSYSVTLGKSYDSNKIEAKLEDGLLEITLVKREETKPRKIIVK